MDRAEATVKEMSTIKEKSHTLHWNKRNGALRAIVYTSRVAMHKNANVFEMISLKRECLGT